MTVTFLTGASSGIGRRLAGRPLDAFPARLVLALGLAGILPAVLYARLLAGCGNTLPDVA